MMARVAQQQQEDWAGIGIAGGLNAVFLALAALILWAIGELGFAVYLALGFGVFWVAILISMAFLVLMEKVFRIDRDEHYTVYIVLNLAVSTFIMLGWTAFIGVTLSALEERSFGIEAVCYVLGFLACYLAFAVLTAFYSGSIYKVVNLALVLVGFLLFAFWPAAGTVLYGWLFTLMGMQL